MKTANRFTCSFCDRQDNEVKKLIAGPAVYICNDCVEACNDEGKRELSFASPKAGGCSFCKKLYHKVAWLAGRGQTLICNECIAMCNCVLDEGPFDCACCRIQYETQDGFSRLPLEAEEYVCKNCVRELVCGEANELTICTYCGVRSKEYCSISACICCRECVDHLKETVRGMEVGGKFIMAMQRRNLTEKDIHARN